MTTTDPTKINFRTQELEPSGHTEALRTGLFQPIEGSDPDIARRPKISNTTASTWTKIFGSFAERKR